MSVLFLIASAGLYVGGNGPYIYLSNQDGDPVTMNWIDISSTGTAVGAGDDWCSGYSASTLYGLGFTFNFYDGTTDSISICSNGAIILRNLGTYISFSNYALPYSSYSDRGFLAVFWDDLNPTASGADDIYFQSFSTCPDGYAGACAVVQYYNVPRYGGSILMNFEVIFYDNGDIKLQYNSALDYVDATIGLQDSAADSLNNRFVQYVYYGDPANHIPDSGTVILFKKLDYNYHTIADIQGTVIPGTDTSAYYGDTVYTSGIIVSKGAKTSKGLHIKMSDGGPFSGVMVYVNDTTGGFGDLQIGDNVLLRGYVTEFYGYTEVVVDSMSHLSLLSSGNTFVVDTITASMISNTNVDTAEMYEGVLVFLDSAVVDSEGTYYYYLSDPTGTALLSKDNIDPLTVGSIISVTGLVIYSYGEYKLLARTPSDVQIIYEPAPVYPALTIDTIQRTMDSTYSTVFVGDTAVVTGVITSLGVSGARNAFLAGNPYGPYNGIVAYFSQGIPSFLNEGDSVEITALITEYYGNTELYVFDTTLVNVLGTGTIPDPIVIPAGYVDTSSTSTYYPEQPDTAEAYEHVLVKVETLQITGYNTTDFGTWFVVEAQKGNDRVYFYVDTLNWGTPAVGDYYNVTGYVYTRYGQYVLVPRSAADLEQVTGSAEDLSGPFVRIASVDRNGIVIRYNLSEPGDVNIRIYAINGRLIVNRSLRLNSGYGELRVPAALRSGVYIINFNGNRFKTIVR